MRTLSLKLSLLFVAIALVAVGIVAVWVNHSIDTQFCYYCEEGCGVYAADGTVYGDEGHANQSDNPPISWMGAAEQAFLDGFRSSLWLAILAAVLVAVILGLVLSRVITRPMRQLTTSATGIAAGDFSQRVPQKGKDEIGELSAAFNSMAEQLDNKEQVRRQLLADIAHELRTPLSIIQGNLEAWLDEVITPTPEQITSVHDETILLSRLVTDLRDLSLAEAGHLKLHKTSTDLDDIISIEFPGFEERAQEQQASIHCDIPSDLPPVFVDADRIRQVLRNLVSNALRYTTTGGTIKIRVDSSPPGWVTICVSDTGSGIDPEDLPYVFDHFFKADKSRHRGYGGSGIGLAIVKQLVEAHGGEVWVESQPGEGSSFYFTVPIAAR